MKPNHTPTADHSIAKTGYCGLKKISKKIIFITKYVNLKWVCLSFPLSFFPCPIDEKTRRQEEGIVEQQKWDQKKALYK